ncbi:MAG TPA: hypothetical protein VMG10_30365 [Gemmataceae bacterium]|nr:hypothetical protein [Gemmataceae bacterium]
MKHSLSELAGILDRCQAGIAAIIRLPVAVPQWTDGLADLLSELLSQAPLTACLLSGEGTACLAIRPGSPRSASEQKRLLQSHLSSLKPGGPGVRKLSAEAVPGLQVLAAAIHEDERSRGFLVVGLPVEASVELAALAQSVLTAAAPAVALRWRLAALQRERGELARFALVGQAFAGLGHELNNALNSMMLQTSVVQLHVDPQVRQELATIRQHGSQAAGLVRSLQHVVQERREKSYPVDPDSVLAEILEEEADLRPRLAVTPASRRSGSGNNLRINSTHSAVKQLIRLLLHGVCAGTKATVKAATGEVDGGAALSLTIADAEMNGGTESDPSAAEVLVWQNLDEVGRYAGKSLLRQLGGTLTVERADDGTLLLRIVWQFSV